MAFLLVLKLLMFAISATNHNHRISRANSSYLLLLLSPCLRIRTRLPRRATLEPGPELRVRRCGRPTPPPPALLWRAAAVADPRRWSRNRLRQRWRKRKNILKFFPINVSWKCLWKHFGKNDSKFSLNKCWFNSFQKILATFNEKCWFNFLFETRYNIL
jgi:hypothetical protein